MTIFSDNPYDRRMEQLMMTVPNFAPRGVGFRFTEAQIFITTTAATPTEILTATMRQIRCPPFRKRFNEYIESEERLKGLVRPDFIKQPYNSIPETQRVILIGCVDNNKSRAICHNVFYNTDNLVYIDSGNGEYTGQVVCGVRQNGRTTFKPVGTLYPDILKAEDKLPTELSCAERAVSAPQSVTANLTSATAVTSFLYDLLVTGDLTTRYVTFSSKIISTRAETVKKRKRRTEKCAA